MDNVTFKQLKDDIQTVINYIRATGVDYMISDIDSRSLYNFIANGRNYVTGWNFLQVCDNIMFAVNFTDAPNRKIIEDLEYKILIDYTDKGIPVALCCRFLVNMDMPILGDTLTGKLECLLKGIPFDARGYFSNVLHVNPDVFPEAALRECLTVAQCKALYDSVRMVIDTEEIDCSEQERKN